MTLALDAIGTIDSSRFNGNQHLAMARIRDRPGCWLQDIGPAGFGDFDAGHGFRDFGHGKVSDDPWYYTIAGEGTMDTDDLEPEKKKVEPINLEVMSIEALAKYIGELEAEISRVREAIAGKEGAQADAETFFKL